MINSFSANSVIATTSLSEAPAVTTYILKHRHRYVRGQPPQYIVCDSEYKRLCLHEQLGQQHCRHRQPSSDENSDDGNDCRGRATSVCRLEVEVSTFQPRHSTDDRYRQHGDYRDRSCSREPTPGRPLCGRIDEVGTSGTQRSTSRGVILGCHQSQQVTRTSRLQRGAVHDDVWVNQGSPGYGRRVQCHT